MAIKFDTIHPMYDRVLVQPHEFEEKSPGGIIIPDTAKDKPMYGVVVAAGHGYRNDDGSIHPMKLTKGMHVIFGQWAGTKIKVSVGNNEVKEYIVMKESDVLAIYNV